MTARTTIIGIIVFLVFVIGASFLLTAGQKQAPAAVTFSAADKERPIVETPETSADLGEMKVSDIRQKDFVLKNVGTKPLQILNVNSSCNCASGQIIYNGTTSKEYGMHAQSGYVTDIAASSSAIVRVIYRPSIMPVYGPVEREVYVETNNPEKAKLVFAIRADVK